ncbi:MAG: NAD(P)-binding domain-containing protein [Ardenticatenaceae bacterium]|nr:NAD(P)-binding domain-containing protein [Ardenticatenaceae bacterium]MCB8987838.1 NAD(P)-binding domain-containing protein [Ardenticatenaceae bacterium]
MNATQSYDTIIIGGGQAGLAAGYYLKQQGRDVLILDGHERIGTSWRNRWDSLQLFTPARYNGLPGMPFPAPAHHTPTKDEMADYLEAYAARFELPVRTGIWIEGLSKQGNQFVLTASSSSTGSERALSTHSGQALRFTAKNVVVATGFYHSPNIPAFSSEIDPDIVQFHSSAYRRPSQVQKGPVLVVGAANSGAEIALELAQSHQVWLSGRHPGNEPTRPGSVLDHVIVPLMWFVFSYVLSVKTPIGRKLRPKFLNLGGVPLARVRPANLQAAGVERVYARTVGAQDGLPVLADGRVLDVSNIIWCTGFQPNYDWIDLPIFDDEGRPIHERGVVTAVRGLYFVGLFFQTALASVLVGGVGRDAAYIAEAIANRSPVSLTNQFRSGTRQDARAA